MDPTLAELRIEIDRLDDEILRLLNARATLAGEVAKLKERTQVPFYVPSRERQIIARLMAQNPGPFPTPSIGNVFQEIFSACLAVESTIRVAYLGPEGTFTHMAAKRQFGLSARTVPVGTIAGVFSEVERGHTHFGVVPVENSTEGVVNHTLDTFVESGLRISAEILVPVSHCLMGTPGLELSQIDRVYSHPQAHAQCRQWLSSNLPRAALVEAPSTAEAAQRAAGDPHSAAIASEMAARLHGLEILRQRIEDLPGNVTRFLVIGHQQAEPTGQDRTSILFSTRDEPGSLYRVLGAIAKHGLNLTRIESRPSRRRAWAYVFFADLDGHQRDPALIDALAVAQQHCEMLKVLGSYPKARPEEGPTGN